MAIRKATTAGARAFICMYSESGGGKTYSALLTARGMVGPKGRIVMIETENGRGEIYADDPAIGGYDVVPLGEPFSPMAYSAAIQEAEDGGADAIVIDSGSHEWEGPGGVLDMAVQAANGGQPRFGDWNKPKAAHKKMIQRIMRSPAHVIVCLRAQYKARQIEQKDYESHGIKSSAKTTILRDDFQSPIQDASFIFETTVHLYFSNQAPGVPIITKCPAMLLGAFTKGQQINVATGSRIAKFYSEGAPDNAAAKDLIKAARSAEAKGLTEYQAFFQGLTKEQRLTLVTAGEHEAIKERLAPKDQPDPDDAPRDRQQDPPAEPDDDGRPDGPGFDDDDGENYVPPNFENF